MIYKKCISVLIVFVLMTSIAAIPVSSYYGDKPSFGDKYQSTEQWDVECIPKKPPSLLKAKSVKKLLHDLQKSGIAPKIVRAIKDSTLRWGVQGVELPSYALGTGSNGYHTIWISDTLKGKKRFFQNVLLHEAIHNCGFSHPDAYDDSVAIMIYLYNFAELP